MRGVFDSQLETQGGHQEAQKHRSAVTHENLGGLEVPTQEPGGCSKNRRRKDGDQRLSVQVSKKGEEHGSHGGHSSTQTVHMIENAERSGDAHDPKDGQDGVQDFAAAAPEQHAENLRANSGEKQNPGSDRHANKQFHLM